MNAQEMKSIEPAEVEKDPSDHEPGTTTKNSQTALRVGLSQLTTKCNADQRKENLQLRPDVQLRAELYVILGRPRNVRRQIVQYREAQQESS